MVKSVQIAESAPPIVIIVSRVADASSISNASERANVPRNGSSEILFNDFDRLHRSVCVASGHGRAATSS